MFTGIIEALGTVQSVSSKGTNRSFWIQSPLSGGFKVDQSVSHSGVCLTVEEVDGERHRVTAIDETLRKTDLGAWKEGSLLNLERCLAANGRLDGHFVQGHVDCTATCTKKKEKGGSWEYEFQFPGRFAALVIEKGSIAVNGISLTVFNVKRRHFTVAIIPYTFEHTNLRTVEPGTLVNLEFDILGKYLQRKLSLKKK